MHEESSTDYSTCMGVRTPSCLNEIKLRPWPETYALSLLCVLTHKVAAKNVWMNGHSDEHIPKAKGSLRLSSNLVLASIGSCDTATRVIRWP